MLCPHFPCPSRNKLLLLIYYFQLFIVTIIIPSYANQVKKDGTLNDLIPLLHLPENIKLYEQWDVNNDNEDAYNTFLQTLIPWIVAEPTHPIMIDKRPTTYSIDCAQAQYKHIFTSKKLSRPRKIVDLVPFGYDVDTLEIRFYETYDTVDAYIIYEAPRTQSAHSKPLFYAMIRNSTRFSKFQDKIIYLPAEDKNLQTYAARTRRGPKSGPGFFNERFALEKSMRIEPIRLFKELSNNVLKDKIMASLADAWIIQNDGDEIPSQYALDHFKQCELISSGTSIDEVYLPSFPFKKNYHWIQITKDLECMKYGNIDANNEYLRFHTWRPGPYIQRLEEVLRNGETLRHRKSDSITPCLHHMGLGSGTHLSSVAEPVSYLMKRYSVIEQDHHGSLTKAFINAGRNKNIDPKLLIDETLIPWCETKHVSELPTTQGKILVWSSIPWIVRYNPWRYPFMLPTPLLSYLENDLEVMIRGNVMPKQVIMSWNQTLTSGKRVQTPYGTVVVFSSVGGIEPCGYSDWKENVKKCTNNL